MTDQTGAVIERLAYDPWGKRRYPNGLADNADSVVGVNTERGYTLHEHLDEIGVIHMNGRVYDPLIGRFMSADPFVQSPGNLQSFNRYAYVMNNPLGYSARVGIYGSGSAGSPFLRPALKCLCGLLPMSCAGRTAAQRQAPITAHRTAGV